jgi:hypothetical protein
MMTRNWTLAILTLFFFYLLFVSKSSKEIFCAEALARRINLDQSNFDFGFAEGLEIVARNAAVGDGFMNA